jgi:hypothetical protein
MPYVRVKELQSVEHRSWRWISSYKRCEHDVDGGQGPTDSQLLESGHREK